MQLQSFYYNANKITLHVKEGGDASAPVILFLHGFPAFWHSWQGQAEYFIAKHYRVIVPDQRGYNLSSKPLGVSAYRLSCLVEDMIQLMTVMKIKQVFIVAHDWGGIVAWALIKQHPQLFAKAVMINAPYLPSYAKFSFAQLVRSWYVYFFQLPWLPEQIMKRNDFKRLGEMMRKSSLPNTFSATDLSLYKLYWQKKGSLTAMINWYRALARYRKDASRIFGKRTPIEVPVLVLWGMKDAFLKPESGRCPRLNTVLFFQ